MDIHGCITEKILGFETTFKKRIIKTEAVSKNKPYEKKKCMKKNEENLLDEARYIRSYIIKRRGI